ncbi:hypothetical protein AB1Y20_014675 [Prymnesium parvum]|uniref:N-acylneuraminate-9-phosphatase n=1 Tax=Prymnesium parvum TaxID=97485 RepID=A0AB34IBH8_PRYPA
MALALCLGPLSFRLITLDLDDTLWPTAPVVAAANAALAAALGATPSELHARLRAERLRASPPPSYSEARVLAVESWLASREGPSPAHRATAERLFQLWLRERHAAAEERLFSGAAAAVAAARRRHPEAAVAAVTNGRGDPLAMPALAPLFDFTVSAEHASIYPARKPEAAPFLAALRRVGLEGREGAWAHVGDDVLNDVLAAKRLGAWAVWLDGGGGGEGEREAAAAAWVSTMGEAEREERARQARKAVGVADVVIRDISELPDALPSPADRQRRAGSARAGGGGDLYLG